MRTVIPLTKEEANLNWSISGQPCQKEIVSRNSEGEPDSVELICRVPNPNKNSLSIYEAIPVESNTDGSRDFLLNSFSIFTTLSDDTQTEIVVNESNYVATRKNGIYSTTKEYNFNGILDGTVYFTTSEGSEIQELDIRIHNANWQNPKGHIVVKEIYIKLHANDFKILPRLGSQRPYSGPHGNIFCIWRSVNLNFTFPTQGVLERRLLIVPSTYNNRDEAVHAMNFGNVGFCQEWKDIAAYGPTKSVLGRLSDPVRLSHKQFIQNENDTLKFCLETGVDAQWVGVYSNNIGPFHPFYIEMEGGHGGIQINHFVGQHLCIEEIRYYLMLHHMNMERQPFFAYGNNGQCTTVDDWLVDGYVTEAFAPFGLDVNGLSVFKNLGFYNQGISNNKILNFKPHDAEHQCRITKNAQALTFLMNDIMAKDDLKAIAELNLLSLHLHDGNPGWSGGFSLKRKHEIAQSIPHQGWILGRARCWMIDAIAAYYSIASQERRESLNDWFNIMAETIVLSDMPTGFNNRFDGSQGSQVVQSAGFPIEYDVAQTFELSFESWAKQSLFVAPIMNSRELKGEIIKGAESLFYSAAFTGTSPKWYIAVGYQGGDAFTPEELTSSLTSGNDEALQGWQVIQHAYLHDSNKQRWIDAFLRYEIAQSNISQKITLLEQRSRESWNDRTNSAIGLIGELKRISAQA